MSTCIAMRIEASLSMQHHNWFVLAAEFAEFPPDKETLEWAFRHPSSDDDDPYAKYYSVERPPIERFGRYWSYQIANGVGEFRHLDPAQLLDVRFEDLSTDPKTELARIATFFDLPHDPGWIERAAAMVNGAVLLRAASSPRTSGIAWRSPAFPVRCSLAESTRT